MTREQATSTKQDDSALEETTRKQLGVERWDRPLIFRETAEAATDIRLPYWSMLVLSGAIATLGLALDNAAVVIGAMLIAPLLAPTMGLALALAVGDLRLASQASVAIVVSTAAVIVTAMLLTAALPFHTFTNEITARTRPTTLDLGIAVFSGLAGAVVTVTRRKGLSAAIPGVAVAVALLPPIAVAGFAAGAGFHWSLIKGSMLLYGANLAGIVLSGSVVFLLIGMHRRDILLMAKKWHDEAAPTRVAAWAARTRWLPTVVPIRSPVVRMALVLAFVAALAVPLTITLGEIARETRVHRAVSRASELFEVQGRSSILSLQPSVGETESHVVIRVATTEWFGDEARERFERVASEGAGEPIRLALEQVPTSSGDLQQLVAQLFPGRQMDSPERQPDLSAVVGPLRERMEVAIGGLIRPEGVEFLGSEIRVGGGRQHLTVGYAGERPFEQDVGQILARQLRASLSAPELAVAWEHVTTDTLTLTGTAADSTRLREVARPMQRYDVLRVAVMADTSVARPLADSTVLRLGRLGAPRDRVEIRHVEDGGLLLLPYRADS